MTKFYIRILAITVGLVLFLGALVFKENVYHYTEEEKPHTLKITKRNQPRKAPYTQAIRIRNVIPSKAVGNCQPIKYKTDTPFPKTALASTPGSGNTWVRHLLQELTGYYTGSIYSDGVLRLHGFPGEHKTDGSVVAIKTHDGITSDVKISEYKKVMVVLRNPYDAALSEFNRRRGGHTGEAPETMFKSEKFLKAVDDIAAGWRWCNMNWLNYTGPLYIVHYERLISHLREELFSMASFLEVSVTEELVECVLKNRKGHFKRVHKKQTFNPYPDSLKVKIDRYIEDVNKKLIERGFKHTIKESVLWSKNNTHIVTSR